MRRWWLGLSLVGVGCGAEPVKPPAPPPQPLVAAAPPVPEAHGKVLVLSGGRGGFDGLSHPAFTKTGLFVALSALGVHRIDPQTGAEKLLIRLEPGAAVRQFLTAGSTALLQWRGLADSNGEAPEHLDLIDVDAGTVRTLPAQDTQWIALAQDGSWVLWVSARGGTNVLYDSKSGAPVQTLVNAHGAGGAGVAIAPSGKYVYVRGSLFDVKSAREVWTLPNGGQGYNAHVEFVSLAGQELLLVAEKTLLHLVQPDTGATHEADVDCLKNVYPYRNLADAKAGVFARFCARGVLYTDLIALRSWSGKKPLAPVRVRDAHQMRVTEAGQLLFLVDSATGRDSFRALRPAKWVQYDPRVGVARPGVDPGEEPEAAGGDYVISRDASRRCEIRAKAAPPASANANALTAPASDTSSSWLCDAELSSDGTLFFQAGDGALTIGAVPSLKTLFSIGDSRRRVDESMEMQLVVEDEKLVARGKGYGSTTSENEFTIERTAPPRKTELTAVDDTNLASLTEEQRKHVRAQLPAARVDECSLVGTLTAPQHATLVVCPESYNSQAYYRFDPSALTLLPGVHVGRVDPASGSVVQRGPYDGYTPSGGSIGTLDDVTVLPDNRPRALYLAQLRDATSHEVFAHLHVGWDFAIADDSNGHVQLYGNRKRAVTWLRCLEDDGSVLPFAACAAKAESTIY